MNGDPAAETDANRRRTLLIVAPAKGKSNNWQVTSDVSPAPAENLLTTAADQPADKTTTHTSRRRAIASAHRTAREDFNGAFVLVREIPKPSAILFDKDLCRPWIWAGLALCVAVSGVWPLSEGAWLDGAVPAAFGGVLVTIAVSGLSKRFSRLVSGPTIHFSIESSSCA